MHYTEFSFTEQGNLKIVLTDFGKERLSDLLTKHADWTDDEVFLELIDEQLMQEWVIIRPEDIRAMRNLLILSNTARYDQDGNLSHVDSAYWHPSDLLGIMSKVLLQRGYIIFEKGR